jgi:hypothetical protein
VWSIRVEQGPSQASIQIMLHSFGSISWHAVPVWVAGMLLGMT